MSHTQTIQPQTYQRLEAQARRFGMDVNHFLNKRVLPVVEQWRFKDKVEQDGKLSESDIFKFGDKPIKMGIPDLSKNLDHYLYGTPKQYE